MATIAEILALPPEERARVYAVSGGARGNIDITNVWIKRSAKMGDYTDDFTDEDKFSNYGIYSFAWHRSDSEKMERTLNGTVSQIWDMPYFITGELSVDFGLMSIDDYRRIMKLIYGRNCFKVKTYDIIYDRMIIIEMYFAPDEMPKLFTMVERLHGIGASSEDCIELIGVQDHKIQMVGTGNDEAQRRYFG